MNTYIKKIRHQIGHEKFIHPAARIIVENDQNEILIIERKDNGKMGLPAGGLEEGETISECIKREVLEETGIEIISMEVIGISSNPKRESVTYPNGDQIQYFTIEFYSNEWKGQINPIDKEEVREAKFVAPALLDALPENEKSALESWAFFRETGKVRMD